MRRQYLTPARHARALSLIKLVAAVTAVVATLAASAPSPGVIFSVAHVQGAGFSATGVHWHLSAAANGWSADASVKTLQLPSPVGTLHDVAAHCVGLSITSRKMHCTALTLQLDGAATGKLVPATLDYDRQSGALAIAFRGRSGGALQLTAAPAKAGWQIQLKAHAMPLSQLPGGWLPAAWHVGKVSAGVINGKVDLTPSGGGWRARGWLVLRRLNASTRGGNQAAQDLTVRLGIDVTASAGKATGELKLALPEGQLYLDPIFIDTGKLPLRASATVAWSSADGGAIHVSKLSFSQPGALIGRATDAVLNIAKKPFLAALNAHVSSLRFPGGYTTYLKPLLAGTALDDLNAAGDLRGDVSIRNGVVQTVRVVPEGVFLHDREKRFSVDRLSGHVAWQNNADTHTTSTLAWKSASILRIPLGPATVRVTTGQRRIELENPLIVPVGSGQVQVDHFVSDDIGTDNAMFFLSAHATPIGLATITRALGWPPFDGSISGRLPPLRYANGTLIAAGDLLAKVFGGSVRASNLKITHPLGRVPILTAGVQLKNLDLNAITSAFSFGNISGRLDGNIKGLRLVDWQPSAFDARFYTPVNGPGPRRISQRAVTQISSLGGGAAGEALSHGILSYFSNFNYSRLGLGCRLQAHICHMSGLSSTPQGYLIVAGAGLPRISVVGHNRQVDWNVLVKQLLEATQGNGPVVR